MSLFHETWRDLIQCRDVCAEFFDILKCFIRWRADAPMCRSEFLKKTLVFLDSYVFRCILVSIFTHLSGKSQWSMSYT